jgi:hypothetical protein
LEHEAADHLVHDHEHDRAVKHEHQETLAIGVDAFEPAAQ